ncbi:MAG: type VI secretion system baseplate subunit TssG [Gemmatimonas sp.]|nr:type VI secretion system baseplate subunit TssG [Gemmatimonas sp.]
MEDATLALRALEEELRANPTAFEFFQAVMLLERLRPDLSLPGRSGDPAEEVVRFSTHRSISFPPSEIRALEMRDGEPARMSVNFMGLIGPQGVLPHHYTQLASDRPRGKDAAFGDFLDLFHHRIISLFNRAWRKNRFWTGGPGDDDPLKEHALDLVGMGLAGARSELPFSEDALVYYSGLVASPRKGAVVLEQLLADYFDVPVEVEQFVGGWYGLPRYDQCELGEENGASSRLGIGAVVGDEVWDQQSGVRLRIGPLTRDRYESFLPMGENYQTLRALTRYFGNDEHDFEVQLVLASAEVPGFVLGEDSLPTPLGWTTWIRTRVSADDADDTILRL